jgi:hypothetical protein
MGKQYTALTDKLQKFIAAQRIFFVGTATADSRVNVSPKGMDCLRVLDNSRVVWLNVTGSGNETSAHIQEDGRMTLMFCAFEGDPLILRIYGTARVIHHNDSEWEELYPRFTPLAGARQIFDLAVELVQTSCGMAVPFLDYSGERDQLADWAKRKDAAGLEKYWMEKNQLSLDGKPTFIMEKNT